MSEQKTAERNWHSIVGPNGMCECGVDAAGVVTTCGLLHQAEVLAGPEACQHGTAMDVHCCHCHSGFIFDRDHQCSATADEWREAIETALGVEPDAENHTPEWAGELVQSIREIGNSDSPVREAEPLKALVAEGLALLTSEARIQYRIPYPRPCDKFEEDAKRSDACATCQWPAADHAMLRILKGISAALEGAATKGQGND